MSNRRASFFLLTCLGAASAHAQSPALLDQVRTQADGAVETARAELAACAKRKDCDPRALSLLTGMLLLSSGDATGAQAQLSSMAAPDGLAPVLGWYLGEARAYAGDTSAAVATLRGAMGKAPAWLKGRLALRIAELEVTLGRFARAAPLLAGAAASPEVLYTRSLVDLGLKRRGQAAKALRTLWSRFPLHPHAALAATALGPVAWTREERLQRIDALVRGGAFAVAHEELAEVPGRDARRLVLEGQALLGMGRAEEGERVLLQAAGRSERDFPARALMILGRRAMRQSRDAEARALFTRLERTFPAHDDADEAGYLAAWLAMNGGALDEAVDAFAAFEERHPRSKRRDEARWFRGFCLLRSGAPARAREVLTSLGEDFPASSLVPQARYWSARSAQQLAADAGSASPELVQAYRDVVAGFPGSFYARLALERLAELGEAAEEPFRSIEEPRAGPVPASLELAARLTRAGLFADASAEVDAVVEKVHDAREAAVLGLALQQLGNYGAAYALAARYLWGAAYTAKDPGALALLYPRAWREPVESWAATNGISPFYAWAIMRRESAFRPEVTSVANARGLMQLIPPTASHIARQTEAPPPHPDALYAPELNVRLGTWYLKALFLRLDHPTLVAAAYNGGPQAVVGWVAARPGVPLDEWIEQIPFKETRGYVKQVVADYFIYRQLYGGRADRLSLTLPTPKREGVNF